MTDIQWHHYIQQPKYWILGIAAGLLTINLTQVSRINDVDMGGTFFLFWAVVCYLLWEKQDKLTWESKIWPSCLGALLILLILLKSASIYKYDFFIRLAPLLSGVALGLIASGFNGLKQYWQELIILSCMAIPPGVITVFVDLTMLTAKFAYAVLWYFGVDVVRQGVVLKLPTGSVEVNHGCNGAHVIIQLLGLSIVFLIMFTTSLWQKLLIPIVAVLIGFLVNSARVALMAILVAYSDKDAFEYWHQGQGSVIFSMIAVLILGVFCWFTVLRNDPEIHPQG